MDSTNTGDHMEDGDTSALDIDPPRVEPTIEAISDATSSSAPETMVDENPKEVRLMNWFEAFDIPTIIKTYHPTPSLKQQVALKEFQAKTRANIELNVAVPRWKEKSSSELVKEEDVEVYTTILVHSAHHGTEYLEEWINKGKILLGLVDTANELGHRIHVVFTHRNWKERRALEIERIQKQQDKGKAAVVDYISSCCSCSGRAIRVAEAPATRKQSFQRPPGDNTSSAPLKPYREPTGTININCHRCLKIFSASSKITDLPQQFKSLIPVVPNDHHLGTFLDFNSWCIDDKPYIEAGKGKSNSWERSDPRPSSGGTSTEATSPSNPTSKRHNIILLTEGTICYWDPIEESLLQLVKHFNRATGSPKLPGKSLDIHIVLIHSKGHFLQLKEKVKRFFAWLNDQSEMREWWQEDWKRWDAAKKLREEWRNKNAQRDWLMVMGKTEWGIRLGQKIRQK
ncbi:hypothetical protein BZA77DRAFT_166369 [Pyronema omphalodes]|nr:hypothetical protein BZA77DRAFT_166369 [Pyronema omphalodes]